MSDGVRKSIVLILLILGLGVCMTCIPGKSNREIFMGQADPSREYASVNSIQLYNTGTIPANTNDTEDLTVLPGIGETIAAAWISEYQENGPFYYPEDLLCVRGIGEKKLESLMPLIDLSPAER